MAGFQRYIGIDYSGAKTPVAGLRGLRVYEAEEGETPHEVRPTDEPTKHWSRRGVSTWLASHLAKNTPTIVGIDHAFSFPEKYFQTFGIRRDWDKFLLDFQEHWPTDQEKITVADILKSKSGMGGERRGDSHWRRLTDKRASAKSAFQFNVPGSVATSTHAGLPWLLYLRKNLPKRVRFWPFDGWRPPTGVSVVVEAYPSLWRHLFPVNDVTMDQHDAYAVAKWLQQADRRGCLAEFLRPMLNDEERHLAEYEGWILGVM